MKKRARRQRKAIQRLRGGEIDERRGDGVRHREVEAQRVRVVDGQKKRASRRGNTGGENYKYFNERCGMMERQMKVRGRWREQREKTDRRKEVLMETLSQETVQTSIHYFHMV